MSWLENMRAARALLDEELAKVTDEELAAMPEHERVFVFNLRSATRFFDPERHPIPELELDQMVTRIVGKTLSSILPEGALFGPQKSAEPRTCSVCSFAAHTGMGPRGDACPILACPGVLQ